MQKKKLSIILSFYNEELNIKNSVEKLTNVLEKINEIDYEIIYVNDCSTDNSLEILKEEKSNFFLQKQVLIRPLCPLFFLSSRSKGF